LKVPKDFLKPEETEEVENSVIRRFRTLSLKTLPYREAFKGVIRDTFAVIFIILLLLGIYRLYRIVFIKETNPKEEIEAYFKKDLKKVWEEGFKTFITGIILVLARKGIIKFLEKASIVKVVLIVEFTFRVFQYGYQLLSGKITWKDFLKKLFEDGIIVVAGLTGTAYGAALGVFLSPYIKGLGPLALALIFGFLGGIAGEFFARFVIFWVEKLVSKLHRKL